MNISDTAQKLLDDVTEEEKEKAMKHLTANTGSHYHRVFLSIIRDYQRALVENMPEHRPAVWQGAYDQVLSDRKRAEKKAFALDRLIRQMGCKNLEEVSQRIQEHAPWNGHKACDNDKAATALGGIESLLAAYYKEAAEAWGEAVKKS